MAERKQRGQAELLRNAILTSIPPVPAVFDQVPGKFVYVPPRHFRALDPDAMLVTGIRGAGKSFWWFVLQQQAIRDAILKPGIGVSRGFGQGHGDSWPDRDELQQLLSLDYRPRLIWKAVLLRQVAPITTGFSDWQHWVDWVVNNPAPVGASLREFDSSLERSGHVHLVLFDAIDRTAETREDQERLLSGLLQLVLELRSFRALRAKVFARPDMLEGPLVKSFPDASKVLASAAKLEWSTRDLYGLLFQYLGNANKEEAARAFRSLAERPSVRPEGTVRTSERPARPWKLPQSLRDDEERQRMLFEAIAGRYMGTNSRRGMTYKWIPNHLEDGLKAVSPRSFLAAIGKAAQTPIQHEYALHWSGLQDGVRHASGIRVDEIQEDLPWAHQAMSLLENLVVPCTRAQIFSAWRKGGLFASDVPALPPDQEGVMEELRRVGILKPLADDRINIPDVYRLGFGLRRKGAFAPRR